MSQEEINYEQSKITQFRQESKNLILPRRSIAFQFQNMRNGNRNFTQQKLFTQRQRRIIKHKIDDSQKRIISLKEALLGRV